MAQKVSQAVYDSGKRESIPKKEKDRPKTRGCAGVYNIWIKYYNKGSESPQSKKYRCDHSKRQTRRVDGIERQRQIVVGIRHDFCRGSAQIYGKSVVIRKTVFGTDGQA